MKGFITFSMKKRKEKGSNYKNNEWG